MTQMFRGRMLAAAVLAVIVVACAKHAPPQVAATPVAKPTSGPNQDSIAAARRDSMALAQHLADSIQAEKDRLAAAAASDRNALTTTIYFAYQVSNLTDQDTAALDQKLTVLTKQTNIQIQIAGNCDERGSDEYNLALGQRRAAAARRYLVDHGIDSTRISLISYGKERPVSPGHDEAAWALDRNDQFVIVLGQDHL